MLKRYFIIILSLLMCISLVACGSKTADNGSAAATVVQEPSVQESPSGNVPETGSEVVPETEAAAIPAVFEPEQYETDALSWEFDAGTGTLSVHGSGPMRSYAEEPPEWEDHKDSIYTLILDAGITSVGAYAFFDYEALTEARLPDSIEVISDSAFDYNISLSTITIPASLKYVGSRAFYNTLLWNPADLVFPEGCEYIGESAFHSALKSNGTVSLPSSLKVLGDMAFTNSYLSDFVVSEGNPVYCSAEHAIYTKDKKTLLMLAPNAASPAEFRIPDGVERISAECFHLIQGIDSVYIPASVKEIAEASFFSTFNLKEIIVDEANPNYRSENGLLLSKDGKLLLAWPDGMEIGSELIIPDGVERIGSYVFYGRTDRAYSVILPESVKEIGTMSLPNQITSLSIPAGLKTIDANVFYNNIYIENIIYRGTATDWQSISVGEGNSALDRIAVQTN